MKRNFFIQAFKYCIVGVLNTLLTAVVIWFILKFIFDVRDEDVASSWEMSIANFSGFFVGVINSFIFNRKWTFKSKISWKIGLVKFMAVFLICYVIQLTIVLVLNKYVSIPSVSFELFNRQYTLTSSYICQLLGIISYTMLNFLANKYYTFKK